MRLLLCLLLALSTSSCGTLAYNSDWSDFDAVGEPGGMVGRWEGRWQSDDNGHEGELRCMMTRVEADDFLARFYSTYGWFLYFRHELVFHVFAEEDGHLRFEGAQDLGAAIGGLYQYAGEVFGDTFEAHYEAENGDHGTFTMQRLE